MLKLMRGAFVVSVLYFSFVFSLHVFVGVFLYLDVLSERSACQ